jgi:hypothetical protein
LRWDDLRSDDASAMRGSLRAFLLNHYSR